MAYNGGELNAGVCRMNVMDRSFPARAEKAKAEFKARRRRAVMLGLAAILIVAAAFLCRVGLHALRRL